jgi:cellulose synthase/poly-beta-1,6-N-acetylglucosamine synthase-like glycosyltransferase
VWLILPYLLLMSGLFAFSVTSLVWMLFAWRNPQALAGTGFPASWVAPQLSFSLIVPARFEEPVLAGTLENLAHLDHPAYEVLVVVGHDDEGTRDLAEAAARQWPERVRVVIDRHWPKSKPLALNAALPACRGSVVGVFDAEDQVDSQLLRHVDSCFTTTGADVVQGGVQLMNFQSSWYALRSCLEYYFWFRSRLHVHAQQRFIPLGGNTVFVRTALLRATGGWDGACLAEDCELGVRLSVEGAKIAVAYDPDLVTREESPPTLGGHFRQRTRWNQGYLQVLRKGVWRQLPSRRARLLARYTLATPFLLGLTWLMIPLAIITIVVLRVPAAVALASWLPAIPFLVMIAVEIVGLRDFGRLYYRRPRLRDYLLVVASAIPYQLLLGAAALRAVIREFRGVGSWEKTTHTGAHRLHVPASDEADDLRLSA